MTQDTQTRWVVGAFGSLLLLAVTTLAGLDRNRTVKDASDALAQAHRAEQSAQRAEQGNAVLRAEVVGDVKAIREQLAQIQKQQDELIKEVRKLR
jgi:hypothetical protein